MKPVAADPQREIRCPSCETLIAKRDEQGLVIQRSGMKLRIANGATVEVTCYQRWCRNVFHVSRQTRRAS